VKERVRNYSIAVREIKDEIIFLHQLVAGGTNRSYGIQVARLAGMPEKIVEKAKKVLENVEKQGHVLGRHHSGSPARGRGGRKYVQLPLFRGPEEAVIEKIKHADITRMTPLEALNYLNMLQEKIVSGQEPENGGFAY
ncbi:MAG: MutS-related protein, partial [Desulfosalsimonas sp.]